MLDEVVADEVTLKEWIFNKQKAEVIFALEIQKKLDLLCFSIAFLNCNKKEAQPLFYMF